MSKGTEADVNLAAEKIDDLFLRLSDGTLPDLSATGFAKPEAQTQKPAFAPVTSEPVTSEPVTPEPVRAEPAAAGPATENLEIIDLGENN